MSTKQFRVLLALTLSASFFACDSTETPEPAENNPANNQPANNQPATNNDTTTADCVPDPAAWDAEIGALVQTHCGTCHGEQPDYGAPYSLTSYAAMTALQGEQRTNELAAAMVGFGTMPPAGIPDLPDSAVAAFVDWASCGQIEPELGTGLKVDRPVFLAPDEAPADLAFFDVRADDFAVAEDLRDLYQCFTLDAPVTSDQFVRRLEVVVDQSEVLHHVVLLRDPERNAPEGRHECPGMPQNSDYLYAWAPGGGPIQFPDGGLRVSPGERFVLQVHYNNAIGKTGVVDTSGVRLFYDAPVGTEYGMIAPGPLAFQIPPGAVEQISGECAISQPTTVLAGMPHMHEIGQDFVQVLERADGSTEPVITLENWQFETQLFYSMPLTMNPGDTLRTTCTFDNRGPGIVRSGERTSDEMCFNFMYVTPPPQARYCDTAGAAPPTDIDYAAGECLLDPPFPAPNLAAGTFVFAAPPVPTGGTLEPGAYELTGFEIYRATATTPVGDIDADASQLLAKGQLVVTDTEVVFDADFLSNTTITGGPTLSMPNDISIAGPVTIADTTLTFDLTCPTATTADFEFSATTDTVKLQRAGEAFGVAFDALYTFQRRTP